jgi:transposase-like protein
MKASIVHRYRLGARVDDLAAEYGVHRSSVYRVLAEKYGRRPYNRTG